MTVNSPLPPPRDMSAELDASFRTVVTQAFEDILNSPPPEPVRVLAERLRMSSEDYVNESHTCVLADGALLATLTRACVYQRGAGLREVPGLPLVALVNPNAYEIEAAVRRLDSARVVVIVEPAVPPIDLVFMHGIPYVTDVTAQLVSRRRRCENSDAVLENVVGDEARIAALLADGLGNIDVSTLMEGIGHAVEGMKDIVDIVELPRVRTDVFAVFDKMNAALSRFSETPAVLLVSYAPASAATTFSRVIGMVLPIHEATQRRRLAQALSLSKSRISELSYGVMSEYWHDVLRRRDERDNARAARRHSPLARRQKQIREAQVMRARRREQEDVAFLHAALQLRGAAATRIQAAWRGCHWRRALRRAVGVIRSGCALSESAQKELLREWAGSAPVGIPPLLARVAERLTTLHGELFGYYDVSPPPVPQTVTLVRPVRTRISPVGDDEVDIESEAEEFVVERVLLPATRQMTAPPHMNPLRRLMECERIAGSDAAEEALTVLRECCGLSVLQRRAYESLKGLVLSLLHIAYLELYHRNMLPLFVDNFSGYVYRFHSEVLAWLSAPHMFSCIVARSSPNIPSVCGRETILTERVLVGPSNSLESLYIPPESVTIIIENDTEMNQEEKEEKGDERKWIKEETNKDKVFQYVDEIVFNGGTPEGKPMNCNFDVREGVRVAPSFLTVSSWECALRDLFASNLLCVSWWSLHPHPAAYQGNTPFILEPRGEQQQVEGRPPYDEFSHFTSPRKSKVSSAPTPLPSARNTCSSRHTAASLQCVRSPDNSSHASPRVTAAALNSSLNSSRRMSYVADGLMAHSSKGHSETLGLSRLVAYEVTVPDPRTKELPLSPFALAALSAEDALLACEMNKNAELPRFMRRSSSLPPFGIFTTAPHTTFSVEMPPLDALAARASTPAHGMACPETQSVKRSSAPTMSRHSTSSIRSGRRRSDTRVVGLPVQGTGASANATAETGADFNSSRSLTSVVSVLSARNMEQIVAARASWSKADLQVVNAPSPHALARPVNDVAVDVAIRVGYKEGSFLHERPWLTPVCGRAFLLVFEKFLFRIVDRIRSGYMLVMALDDPFQLIYFHSACLLKLAARRSPEAEAQSHASSKGIFEGRPRSCGSEGARAQDLPASLLSPEAKVCLAPLDRFLTHIAGATHMGSGAVHDAYYTVLSVIQVNSPGGLAFLENIVGMVRAAEKETNRRRIEDIILTIARRLEQLCWLILLQIFIVSSVPSNVFLANNTEKLSSFTVFVECLDVMPFLDNIDPWLAAPERSPDPFHLRYSNGLRRWDDRSYIYQGAFFDEKTVDVEKEV